jgi:hypothetical protein
MGMFVLGALTEDFCTARHAAVHLFAARVQTRLQTTVRVVSF